MNGQDAPASPDKTIVVGLKMIFLVANFYLWWFKSYKVFKNNSEFLLNFPDCPFTFLCCVFHLTSIYLSIYLPDYLPDYLPTYPSTHPPTHLPTYLLIYQPVCLSCQDLKKVKPHCQFSTDFNFVPDELDLVSFWLQLIFFLGLCFQVIFSWKQFSTNFHLPRFFAETNNVPLSLILS